MGSTVPESQTARARGRIGQRPAMRQELIQLGDGMIGDTREHIAEPSERIHFHQLTGSYKAPQHRHSPAAAITSQKHPVVAAYRDPTQGSFRAIVVNR